MPKISRGGVSDVSVDENFIAPPGTPPADAIERGLPDAGARNEEDSDERDDERKQQPGSDPADVGAGRDDQARGARDGNVSRKRAETGKRGNGSH